MDIGKLDAELAAFEAGHPFIGGQDEPAAYQSLDRDSVPAEGDLEINTLDWASDFQRLHLENVQAPSAIEAQPSLQSQVQEPTTTKWHEDSAGQDFSTTSVMNTSEYYQRPYVSPIGYSMHNGFAAQFPSASLAHYRVDAGTSNDQQIREFERAFDLLDTDLQSQQEEVNTFSSSGRQPPERDTMLQQPEIDSDESTKPYVEEYSHLADPYLHTPHLEGYPEAAQAGPEQPRPEPVQDDADALAATATQLLENVKDESSRKFRESKFLSLMRQLRDREVHVEGDKIVNVSPTT